MKYIQHENFFVYNNYSTFCTAVLSEILTTLTSFSSGVRKGKEHHNLSTIHQDSQAGKFIGISKTLALLIIILPFMLNMLPLLSSLSRRFKTISKEHRNLGNFCGYNILMGQEFNNDNKHFLCLNFVSPHDPMVMQIF